MILNAPVSTANEAPEPAGVRVADKEVWEGGMEGTAPDERERSGRRYALLTRGAFGGMAPAIIIERIAA